MSFFRKSRQLPDHLLLESTSSYEGNTISVEDIWMPTRSATNLADTIMHAMTPGDNEIDTAFAVYLQKHGISSLNFTPLHTYHFTNSVGLSGNQWHHGAEYRTAIKGTAERILQLCDLSDSERESLMITHNKFASNGLAVVALATTTTANPTKKLSQLLEAPIFQFSGYVVTRITPSNQLVSLLAKAQRHSIKVHVLTGQHPESARKFANQLRIPSTALDTIDIRHLEVKKGNVVEQAILTGTVYARATEDDKKMIIKIFEKSGLSFMTVNSLEELKKAVS